MKVFREGAGAEKKLYIDCVLRKISDILNNVVENDLAFSKTIRRSRESRGPTSVLTYCTSPSSRTISLGPDFVFISVLRVAKGGDYAFFQLRVRPGRAIEL